MIVGDETAENAALADKRWGEYSEEQKHLLELAIDLYGPLNRIVAVIERTRPGDAAEIRRFQRGALHRLSLYDPFDQGDATQEEIEARAAFVKLHGHIRF